jgi:hypothetical protein
VPGASRGGGGGFNFLASFRSGEGGKRGRKRKRII